MKEIQVTRYKCEHCGTIYETRQQALMCEDAHYVHVKLEINIPLYKAETVLRELMEQYKNGHMDIKLPHKGGR
jgi:hypothetical protein